MTHLYKILKENKLVSNEKEFEELIHLRQISIDDKIIDTSLFNKDKIRKIKVGILEKII